MQRIEFVPCPKCGQPEPYIEYVGPERRSDHYIGGHGYTSFMCKDHGEGQHFHVECGRCRFAWFAEIAPAPERPRGWDRL